MLHRLRGSELSASCGRVSETENGQEEGELRTNVSKATLFQPGLNLGGLPEGEHLAALARFELFPFRLLITFAATNAGWNMVVLLRCRVQYSLFRPILPSLHRPPGALGSNPP